MRPDLPKEGCGLVGELNERVPANRHQAMLGLPTQPMADTHFVLYPGQRRFVFEPPGIDHGICISVVSVCGPQPKDAVSVRQSGDVKSANRIDRHLRIGQGGSMRSVVFA